MALGHTLVTGRRPRCTDEDDGVECQVTLSGRGVLMLHLDDEDRDTQMVRVAVRKMRDLKVRRSGKRKLNEYMST